MYSGICDHLSILIKIIQTIIGSLIHHQIVHIPHLRRSTEFSQIIHHITAIKRNFRPAPVLCGGSQISDLDHMRISCCKFTVFIMIIISVKYRTINHKMIKIMHCRCIFSGSVFIQAVKTTAF